MTSCVTFCRWSVYLERILERGGRGECLPNFFTPSLIIANLTNTTYIDSNLDAFTTYIILRHRGHQQSWPVLPCPFTHQRPLLKVSQPPTCGCHKASIRILSFTIFYIHVAICLHWMRMSVFIGVQLLPKTTYP